MGILDRTHIAIYKLATDCKPYKNQMCDLLQNICIIYDINIKFAYGLAR